VTSCSRASFIMTAVTLGHLDIHLQASDAIAGTGNFEIHVAVMIFGSGYIGENGVIVAFLHQAMATPPTCADSGTPASIRAREAQQNRGHGTGPLDSRMSRPLAVCRETGLRGYDRRRDLSASAP